MAKDKASVFDERGDIRAAMLDDLETAGGDLDRANFPAFMDALYQEAKAAFAAAARLKARAPSDDNWRLASAGGAREKDLDAAIVHVMGGEWGNRVATATGIYGGRPPKQHVVDLVHLRPDRAVEFYSLPPAKGAVDPAGAALQLLDCFVDYLLAKRAYPPGTQGRWRLLETSTVELVVLLHAEDYADFDAKAFAAWVNNGLAKLPGHMAGISLTRSFRFEAFPGGFTWPCEPAAVKTAMANFIRIA
mgnify:CR=1 FL=1